MDVCLSDNGPEQKRRRIEPPEKSFIVANLCEKIIGSITGLHLQLDTVEDQRFYERRYDLAGRTHVRVRLERYKDLRLFLFLHLQSPDQINNLFALRGGPGPLSLYSADVQKSNQPDDSEWSREERRETNGPPILKIELLPGNDSEILNAGTSRLMPPPPISSTNTFESLRWMDGGMVFIVGPLPRLLSSFAFWSHFVWTTDQLHYNARLFFGSQSFNGLRLLLDPSLFHRRLFNLKCIIFLIIFMFLADLVVSCSISLVRHNQSKLREPLRLLYNLGVKL